MKPRVKPELSAMRARWAQSWAERQAAPADTLTPDERAQRAADELAQRAADEPAQRKAESLRVAAHHRALQAEAAAHGDKTTARTLGMLAAHLEQSAALAEAEIRDRAAKAAKWQRTARNRAIAKHDRPGRRPALRDVLAETLGPLKREGVQFRVLLRRWRMERIGALRLEDLGAGRFRVTDEGGDEAAHADYTRGTLQRLYSESR
jgi:hypothetical protein